MGWAIPNMALSATLAFRLRYPAKLCSPESLNSGDAHQYTTLNLRIVAAPKNFHTDRQNNWCFFNVLWYKNVTKISNKTANINVKKLQFIQMLTATSLHIENSKNKKGDITQQHIAKCQCVVE